MAKSDGKFIRQWLTCMVAVVVVLSFFNGVAADPQVPCYFIFGDSLVDNGNNNALQSLARADYLPYGIDFNGGPTGRFSNGKTTVDVIGKIASHQSLSKHVILHSSHFLSSHAYD